MKGNQTKSLLKKRSKVRFAFLLIVMGAIFISANLWAQLPQPMLSEDNLKRVSDHVYVIESFPNVAIVVRTRVTLAVDTGLASLLRP
jgi:hypothetical protein